MESRFSAITSTTHPFEEGFGPYWHPSQDYSGCFINYARYGPPNGVAGKDNQYFLESNRNGCTSGSASIFQDVTAYPSVGDMFQARVWVRSRSGDRIRGSVALWHWLQVKVFR